MDLQSLVAAHISERRPPRRMSAAAEDRYYGKPVAPRRPRLRRPGPLVAVAAAILLVIGVFQV